MSIVAVDELAPTHDGRAWEILIDLTSAPNDNELIGTMSRAGYWRVTWQFSTAMSGGTDVRMALQHNVRLNLPGWNALRAANATTDLGGVYHSFDADAPPGYFHLLNQSASRGTRNDICPPGWNYRLFYNAGTPATAGLVLVRLNYNYLHPV